MMAAARIQLEGHASLLRTLVVILTVSGFLFRPSLYLQGPSGLSITRNTTITGVVQHDNHSSDNNIIVDDEDLPLNEISYLLSSSASPNSRPNHTFSREFLEESRAKHEKLFVYKMADHGLGAVLMNLFYKMLYMEEIYNRNVIVDETVKKYRRNQTMGVLTGYFTLQMPVIDTKRQFAIINPILAAENKGMILNKFPSMRYNYLHPSNLNNDTFIFLTGHTEYRKAFRRYYQPILHKTELYHKLLRQACPHMNFNAQTQQELMEFRNNHGLQYFSDERITSVAFHIRRGDKIYTESRAFSAEEYVQRFLSIQRTQPSPTHCYIATDDEAVVANMTLALRHYNISCNVHSLADNAMQQKRHGPAETRHFLTELSVPTERCRHFRGIDE